MIFRKGFIFSLGIVFLNSAGAQTFTVVMQNVKLDFQLDNKGIPNYSVWYNGQAVIKPSQLGFKIKDAEPLDANFELTGIDSTAFDETWKPVWGEVSSIRNHYKEL